jgi:sulfur carrier protein
MRIQINGEANEVPDGMNLLKLLDHLSLSRQRVAVEVDRQVVRRAEWDTTLIHENAVIEIVHFVGGG